MAPPRLAFLLLALLAAACAVAPEAGSLASPAARGDAAAAGAATAEPERQEPWTLDAVLARIAAANPTLGAARASLAEAQAASDLAAAASFPELSLGLDYLSTDDPARAFSLLLEQERLTLGPAFDPTPGTTDNWRKEIRLDWPLFAPGRRESRRAADAAEQAAALEAEAVERRLLNAGVQAWILLRAAREHEQAARASVAVVRQRLELTRIRLGEGVALRVDVLRLDARLAEAEQAAARAALAARSAESALLRLMGATPGAALALAEEDLALGEDLPETLEDLTARAAAERRDLAATALRLRMAGDQSDAARAARLPTLQVFAAYDVDGPDLAWDSDLDSSTIGVGLRLPFSARTGARIRGAEAGVWRAREDARALALAVEHEVRDAWDGLGVATATLALAERAVAAAEEAFQAVAAAQDAGGATVTDVLEAEDALARARVQHVAAQAGAQIARARLIGATGGVR